MCHNFGVLKNWIDKIRSSRWSGGLILLVVSTFLIKKGYVKIVNSLDLVNGYKYWGPGKRRSLHT